MREHSSSMNSSIRSAGSASSTTPTTQHGNSRRELSDVVVRTAKSTRLTNANRAMSTGATLNQLRLTNLKLHGREGDIKVLRSKLVQLKNNGNTKIDENEEEHVERRRSSQSSIDGDKKPSSSSSYPELILVSGISGAGKSALVMKGLKEPAIIMGISFVSGKFDVNNSSPRPMSAFVDAMVALSKLVVSTDEDGNVMDKLGQQIQDEINDVFSMKEQKDMVRALPGCEALFPYLKNSDGDEEIPSVVIVGKDAISRLQYAIRRLLQVICSNLKGVVLFIDDLQWSDAGTLDLLKSISLDSDLSSLIVVGAYRQDEVPETHPLELYIQDLHFNNLTVTRIHIGNLSSDHVKSLVAEVLRMEDDEDAVSILAETVHAKTDGNAFFVLMFLRSIYEEELLQFNFGTMKWRWDDEVVKARLMTQNVATVMVNKLKRLDPITQTVLSTAACLGSSIDTYVLSTVVGSLSMSEGIEYDTTALLDDSITEFEVEGIWERDTENETARHFSHDQIQMAAIELIPPNKRDTFRGKIGNIMMKKLDPERLENCLFEVVSLRNCGSDSDSESDDGMELKMNGQKRLELAQLNLRAGIKASNNAAFDFAAIYFKKGYELLGYSDGWSVDRELMLQLCGEGANACFVNGDLDDMHVFIAEVLGQDDIPTAAKFRVYEVKVLAAHASAEFNLSLNTAFDFRKQLGLPTLKNKPANPLIVLKKFIKTNRMIGNKTAEDIANLPELTDERIVMGQRMLELAATSSFLVQPTMFPLIVFLLVQASLKYGINASSCDAFGGFGVIYCAFGKFQDGMKMSKAVELILADPSVERIKSRSMFVIEGFIHHWTMPLQGTLAPLLEAYQVGLKTGDIDGAASSLLFRINHSYYSGRNLEAVDQEAQASIDSMTQLNQEHPKMSTTVFLCLARKLRGHDTDSEMERMKEISSGSNGDQSTHAAVYFARLEISVYFRKWDDAVNALIEGGDLRECSTGLFGAARFTFLEGLISIQAARQSSTMWKKRRWRKNATRSIKLIRGWVKHGSVNLVHNLHLLVAELAAYEGKNNKASEHYKSAISVATRNGFLQDRALSHECASVYFDSRGDDYWKNYHNERCKEAYAEWGATAKVDQLNDRDAPPIAHATIDDGIATVQAIRLSA